MLGVLGLILIVAVGLLVIFYNPPVDESAILRDKYASKLGQLWRIEQSAFRTKKYAKAEKALLLILRIDERNATAYNRLGMLFAKQRNFDDAIECFEIAQSLSPSASSFHNVGLVYMETGNLEKAALAFENAMKLEPNSAFRHISYAQILEKLGNKKSMIEELEKAVELEPTPQVLRILAQAYDEDDRKQLARSLRSRATELSKTKTGWKNIRQPRKVVL